MKQDFINWMKKEERKSDNTSYQYGNSIDKISKLLSSKTGKSIDIYSLSNLTELTEIEYDFSKNGKYSEFGNQGKGTIRNAIATYVRYVKAMNLVQNNVRSNNSRLIDDNTFDETFEDSLNFTYERDLKNSLAKQASELFPEYKIFGNKSEGIEYGINGKRIDLLLENKNENTLLAIELKSGEADFQVFGQISMYMGLLLEKFPTKNIKGIIIAGSINQNLINACKITDKIELKTYNMQISLNDV